jgi:hypothetical protein
MKTLILLFSSMLCLPAFAQTAKFSPEATKTISHLLKSSRQKGNKAIVVKKLSQGVTYSVAEFSCYFPKKSGEIDCSGKEEFSEPAAKVIGALLRDASKEGDQSIIFGGGPQVTTYTVGNVVCYFQNDDGSVSCSLGE